MRGTKEGPSGDKAEEEGEEGAGFPEVPLLGRPGPSELETEHRGSLASRKDKASTRPRNSNLMRQIPGQLKMYDMAGSGSQQLKPRAARARKEPSTLNISIENASRP